MDGRAQCLVLVWLAGVCPRVVCSPSTSRHDGRESLGVLGGCVTGTTRPLPGQTQTCIEIVTRGNSATWQPRGAVPAGCCSLSARIAAVLAENCQSARKCSGYFFEFISVRSKGGKIVRKLKVNMFSYHPWNYSLIQSLLCKLPVQEMAVDLQLTPPQGSTTARKSFELCSRSL